MIVIFTAQDQYLESQKDDRFGRCPWFIKMDTVSNQWEAFPNPGVGHSSGAGVAAAQFVIDQKAEAVISGDFGPHAVDAFRAANISMFLYSKEISSIQQAVEGFKQEKFSRLS
jgi:predicted Fe-Mo cluster-binding NifX family protein